MSPLQYFKSHPRCNPHGTLIVLLLHLHSQGTLTTPPITASHVSPATFRVLYALQQYPPACPTLPASPLEYVTLAPTCPMLHGVTEPRRLEGPLGVSSPTPLPKHSQVEEVTQGHVQFGFEYLQGWRLHSLSGQPEFHHPHSKKVSSHF